MQVRDYIKQATMMMDRLKQTSSADPMAQGKARKLAQVIDQLREQEQNYMDFLMKVLVSDKTICFDFISAWSISSWTVSKGGISGRFYFLVRVEFSGEG